MQIPGLFKIRHIGKTTLSTGAVSGGIETVESSCRMLLFLFLCLQTDSLVLCTSKNFHVEQQPATQCGRRHLFRSVHPSAMSVRPSRSFDADTSNCVLYSCPISSVWKLYGSRTDVCHEAESCVWSAHRQGSTFGLDLAKLLASDSLWYHLAWITAATTASQKQNSWVQRLVVYMKSS